MKTLNLISGLIMNQSYIEDVYIASRVVKDRIAIKTGVGNSYINLKVDQFINEKNIGGVELGFNIVFREGSTFDHVKQYVEDSPEYEKQEDGNSYSIVVNLHEYILRIERSEPGDYFVLKFQKL